MLTNVEIVYREGLPDNCLMVAIPASGLWLKCLKWENGKWGVTLVDPLSTWSKEVWRSIAEHDLARIIENIFVHNEAWSKGLTWKQIKLNLFKLKKELNP